MKTLLQFSAYINYKHHQSFEELRFKNLDTDVKQTNYLQVPSLYLNTLLPGQPKNTLLSTHLCHFFSEAKQQSTKIIIVKDSSLKIDP